MEPKGRPDRIDGKRNQRSLARLGATQVGLATKPPVLSFQEPKNANLARTDPVAGRARGLELPGFSGRATHAGMGTRRRLRGFDLLSLHRQARAEAQTAEDQGLTDACSRPAAGLVWHGSGLPSVVAGRGSSDRVSRMPRPRAYRMSVATVGLVCLPASRRLRAALSSFERMASCSRLIPRVRRSSRKASMNARNVVESSGSSFSPMPAIRPVSRYSRSRVARSAVSFARASGVWVSAMIASARRRLSGGNFSRASRVRSESWFGFMSASVFLDRVGCLGPDDDQVVVAPILEDDHDPFP